MLLTLQMAGAAFQRENGFCGHLDLTLRASGIPLVDVLASRRPHTISELHLGLNVTTTRSLECGHPLKSPDGM